MKKKTIAKIIYAVAFVVISLLPLFFFNAKQGSIGNEDRVPKPQLFTDEGINMEYTSQLDSYFSQNFGFRNQLVAAGNLYKSTVFQTSGNSNVIIGSDGWLFYASALKDYTGEESLSDSELTRIATILKMTSAYVKSQNADFLFVIAPDKLSVYGEYMPYYYTKNTGKTDYDRLSQLLVSNNVPYADLKAALINAKSYDTILYHKKDSHWNNLGAAIGYEAVIKALGSKYTANKYSTAEYTVTESFCGDLEAMLLPGNNNKDQQIELHISDNVAYADRFRGFEEMLVNTTSNKPVNDSKVVLYRDSFGNALCWFFANDFRESLFKREIPYNIYSDAKDNDTVVIELVERNIGNLLTMVPIVPSYKQERALLPVAIDTDKMAECYGSFKQEGLYELTVSASELEGCSNIHLTDGEFTYAFLPGGDGCQGTMYLETEDYSQLKEYQDWKVVYCNQEGQYMSLATKITFQD